MPERVSPELVNNLALPRDSPYLRRPQELAKAIQALLQNGKHLEEVDVVAYEIPVIFPS